MSGAARGKRWPGANAAARAWAMAALALLAAGCYQAMSEQPSYRTFEASELFADGRSARPLPEGTVPRGQLRDDALLYEGTEDGAPAERFPFPVTEEVLREGRVRYDIYCLPCHGQSGYGDGMVVRRGFPAPASFHSERLREAPPGYYFTVITQGFGRMQSYAHQVEPAQRWAITAYIRALQRSQWAPAEALEEEDLRRLPGGAP